MQIEKKISSEISEAFKTLFDTEIPAEQIILEGTKKEFEGNFTFVVFPYLKISRLNPEATAQKIGEYILEKNTLVGSFQVVKGFLNITIKQEQWVDFLNNNYNNNYANGVNTIGRGQKVMVEYSSPNTNKPLHLGHIRNNLLGYSISNLLKANGYEVIKVNLINDRGIHICKSMTAWLKFGNKETPSSSGLKGDHLVGKYYVAFDKAYKEEIDALIAQGVEKELAEKEAPIMKEATEMLVKWEQGDPEIISLWQTMNGWVYDGFEITYKTLGVDFDHTYYESNTYKLGKEIVEEGLKKGVFYQEKDNSVWIDLTTDKLDKKLLLRSNGTSVYMTQDLGTAELKFKEFNINKSIYVVGNEQDYHFKVLFKILEKLERPYAKGLYHLSYGMVDLPSGKMKSREGTVVDADDLLEEMFETARQKSEELGKTEGMSAIEKNQLYKMLGLAALKFFILKVDPQKRMLFNPQESIDFQGDTGTFVQYTYARIQSLIRQAGKDWEKDLSKNIPLHETEVETLILLYKYNNEVLKAAQSFSPAIIAAYCIDLAKAFNRVYKEVSFLRESDINVKNCRLKLAFLTGKTIKSAMGLLGIEVPEQM
ncbi:MAG: arginine--tRNA ligase [Bacteroidetes bacterium]|nr:arginine--tRNA ligase [Bacteroidota bacterium]